MKKPLESVSIFRQSIRLYLCVALSLLLLSTSFAILLNKDVSFAAMQKIDAGSVGVPKKAASEDNLKKLLNRAYQLSGAIAVIVIIISGLRMIVGGDNSETVATARKAIIYASAGLVVIISAFIITQFIINVGST